MMIWHFYSYLILKEQLDCYKWLLLVFTLKRDTFVYFNFIFIENFQNPRVRSMFLMGPILVRCFPSDQNRMVLFKWSEKVYFIFIYTGLHGNFSPLFSSHVFLQPIQISALEEAIFQPFIIKNRAEKHSVDIFCELFFVYHCFPRKRINTF